MSQPPAWFAEILRSLPPVSPQEPRNEADFYGATDLIAAALGLSAAPTPQAVWTHGWHYNPPQFVETFLWQGPGPGRAVLTHRENDAAFLRANQAPLSVAVGAPFLYVPAAFDGPRLPDSLLIMPFHSLDETRHIPDEQAYFEAIDPHLARFAHVAACIHPSCVKKNLWIGGLAARGIPWVNGAEVRDRNALRRVRSLLSRFTHVTSNWIGSHVPYAALLGCRVSIFGPPPVFRREDYENQPFYKQHPQILERDLDLLHRGYVRETFPQFFAPPDAGVGDPAWAWEQLGGASQKDPVTVARLLGWGAEDSPELPFSTWAERLGWSGQSAELERLRDLVDRLTKGRDAWQQHAGGLEEEIRRLRQAEIDAANVSLTTRIGRFARRLIKRR